ncbi:MAG: T9SS type A sorting domain-containing protein [Ignavibacteriae bacterium]|nr:T9SS type A sorting domain-containing protein [Ignavibacteriota bacterium]
MKKLFTILVVFILASNLFTMSSFAQDKNKVKNGSSNSSINIDSKNILTQSANLSPFHNQIQNINSLQSTTGNPTPFSPQATTVTCYPNSGAKNTGTVNSSSFVTTDSIDILSGGAWEGFAKFNISSIPSNAVITAVTFSLYVNSQSGSPYHRIIKLSNDPVTTSAATLYTNITTGSQYAAFGSTIPTGAYYTYTLTGTAAADVQAAITQGWFALGIYEYESGTTYSFNASGYGAANKPYISVTYSIPTTFTSTATGGLWSSPGTWVNNAVPSTTDFAVITAGSTVTLDNTVGATVTVASLVVNGNLNYTSASYALYVTGTTTVSGTGSLNDNGAYLQASGNTTIQDGGTLNVYSNGASTCGEFILFDGATMTVDIGGTLNVNNQYASYGYVVLGIGSAASATLTVNGTLNINTVAPSGATSFYTGSTITVNGKLNYTQGGFNYPSTAIVYGASATLNYLGGTVNSSNIWWPTSSSPYNVGINSSGTITLNGAKTVNGTLTLANGTLSNGTNLTLGNGATINRSAGSLSAVPTFGSSVNVIYSGSSPISSGYEIPTTPGVLNNLTTNTGGVVQSAIPGSSSTVDALALQNFEGVTFPPTSWTTSGGTSWVRKAGDGSSTLVGGNGTANNAFFPHSSTTWPQSLITPTFDCSDNTGAVTLAFYYNSNRSSSGGSGSSYDPFTVYASTDGGNNWTSIMTNNTRQNGWTQKSITLSSGFGLTMTNNMKIRFEATSKGTYSNCMGNCVDEVKVTKQTTGASTPSTITVNGIFDLTSGSLNIGANNLVLNGGISGSSAIVGGSTSDLSVGGSGLNISLPSITNGLHDFIINRTDGVTLSSNLLINGSLNLTNGNIYMGSSTLTLGTDITYTGTLNPSVPTSGSYIVGSFERWIPASTTSAIYFPVGSAGQFRQAIITFTAAPSGGKLKVSGFDTDPGTTTTNTSLTESGGSNYVIDRYSQEAWWNVTPSGFNNGTYDISLQVYNISGVSIVNYSQLRVLKRETSSPDWALVGSHVNASGTVEGSTVKNITVNRTGLSGFSDFGIGGYSVDGNVLNNAPLPVLLSSFSSVLKGHDVNLTWKTDRETNNAGFDVERKSEGSNLWNKVGYVKGKGSTNSPASYTFEDKKLNSGKYNYRLKQIDYNGNFEYHNLATIVDVALPTKFNLSQNYPNPFNPTTKIDFDLPFDSKVNIVLYDMTGREVKTLVNETRTAGYYTVQFNAADLSSGMYFYRIITKSSGKDFVMTKKMMLVK